MKKLVDTFLVAAILMSSIPGLAEDLDNAMADSEGRGVTMMNPDGSLYVQDDSSSTVTTGVYDTACDTAGAGVPSSWEEHVV